MSSVNRNGTPIYQGEELMGYSLSNAPTVHVDLGSFRQPNQAFGKAHFVFFCAAALHNLVRYMKNRKVGHKQESNELSKDALIYKIYQNPDCEPDRIQPAQKYTYDSLSGERIPIYQGQELMGYIPLHQALQQSKTDSIAPSKKSDSTSNTQESSVSSLEESKSPTHSDQDFMGDAITQIPQPQKDNIAPPKSSDPVPKTEDKLEIDQSKTKNAESHDLYRDIQEKRMKKQQVEADPQTDQKQREKARQDYSEALEKGLEFEFTGKDPLDNPKKPSESIQNIIDKKLEKIEHESTEKGEIGKAKLSSAKQERQNAAKMQKGADKLKKELFCNPNAQEITINTRNGPIKLTRDEALHRMQVLESKVVALKATAKTNFQDGLKQVPSAIKGKMTSELRKQAQHLPNTVKTAGILNGADALLDVIEGKTDLGTAVQTAATSTIKGVALQTGASLVVEGIKEAITIVSPGLAENIPGVGTIITVGSAISVFNSASTAEEGLKNVGYMGAEAVGELATITTLAFFTGGAGIPVIIGGKASWRAAKYIGGKAWNWSTSSNTE